MSRNGGYKILDLTGHNYASGVAHTVPGIFEKIEETTKRTVISGLTYDSTEVKDFEVLFTLVASKWTTTLSVAGDVLTMTVDDDDAVKITEVE